MKLPCGDNFGVRILIRLSQSSDSASFCSSHNPHAFVSCCNIPNTATTCTVIQVSGLVRTYPPVQLSFYCFMKPFYLPVFFRPVRGILYNLYPNPFTIFPQPSSISVIHPYPFYPVWNLLY